MKHALGFAILAACDDVPVFVMAAVITVGTASWLWIDASRPNDMIR